MPVSIKSGLLWHDNEESALTLAKEQKKPVVIDFAADWCSACKRIDKNTFSSQNVLSELQRFVLLKIDCTDSNDDDVKRLLKKYDVVGLPSILFVHSDGNIDKQKRITSYIGPDDFFEILRTIE